MRLSDLLIRYPQVSVPSNPHRYAFSSEYVDEMLAARVERYPYSASTNSPWAQTIQDLKLQGFAVVPSLLSSELVNQLLGELESCLAAPETCKSSYFYGHKDPYFTKVIDPFIHAPSILPLAVGDRLVPVVSEYFGCKPILASANLRRSFVTNAPPAGNQLYHVDQNTTLMLKVFFYLNDVDLTGGPFMYIRSTNRFKHPGWNEKYLWSHQEIKDIYGIGNMVPLTAKAGDAILALTNKGFHCGLPPLSRERSMLTLNYMVHAESHGSWRITQAQHDSLTSAEKCIAEILERV